MPDAVAPAAASAAPPAAGIRIVLFGMPDAGKSSLLGALAQAAQLQEHLLGGRLTDVSQGLAELQRRLYEDQPRETLQEVVPYPVVFDPTTAGPQANADDDIAATLVDCDGRVANDLLTRRRDLLADSAEGTLAQAILGADALLLVVDAAANPAQVDADFKEFGRFLRLLEQSRGRRSDVGGLPIFLVLSKCDLLAKPGDSPAAWIERIEERKRQVDQRFREFIAQERSGPVRFGGVDLHLWATAVKRPALANTPALAREPYGVAELFRQAFTSAELFQERRQRSGRRLVATVTGAITILAGMATLVSVLIAHRQAEDPRSRELLTKIESYRSREAQTPSARLREPLQAKIGELTDLEADPSFASLPVEKQQYVHDRLHELDAYRTYREKLLHVPPLSSVRNERELEEVETALTDLPLPAEHQTDWKQTEAALFRQQRLDDVKALRTAVDELTQWYQRLERRGQDLERFASPKAGAPVAWSDWLTQVQSFLDDAENPPHRPGERLPGSSTTYDVALQFGKVASARRSLDALRVRLLRIRDMSVALGLAGSSEGRAPLDIPAGFTADQAAGRLQELERRYPRYREEFTTADLPEALAAEIRRAARVRYDRCIQAGQEVVLRHLRAVATSGEETLAEWRQLLPWLQNPDELTSWRQLATLLGNLQALGSGDLLRALETFLAQDRFDVVVRRLVLEIPDDTKIQPVGRLAIHHQSGSETRPTLYFERSGDEQRDLRRGITRYSYRPSGGVTIPFRPGDNLWAELAVRVGDKSDYLLTWARNRSRLWEFERLTRPPRLHRKDQSNAEGQIEDGVLLEISPADGVPRVPDLVPIVPVRLQ